MRNAVVLLILLSVAGYGQKGTWRFSGAPAARPGGGSGVRPGSGVGPRVGPRVARPRVYGGWPFGGWWGGTSEAAAAPAAPEEHEKETPALVVNPDFVRERLTPQTTEYAEGALPAPKRTFAAEGVKAECRVKFRDGSSVAAQACGLRDDTLEYVDRATGRRTRVSLDLVEGY